MAKDIGENNQNPRLVYVHAHSKEVSINFNKKVHLDHFHYRVNVHKGVNNFYIQTYDEGRLILNYTLSPNQLEWIKVTFPRSKVPIDKIIISQCVELDNISLHYLMKVKERVPYTALNKIPVSNKQEILIPKAGIDDLARNFENQPKFQHLANTLELIADVVFLYQLDKPITEYLNLKKAT